MTANPAALVGQLRETLGKMEVALSAIREAIVWTDERGSIQWCNATFDHLVGRPHLEVLGMSLFDLLPLEQKGELLRPERHPINTLEGTSNDGHIYDFVRGNQRFILEISSSRIQLNENEVSIVHAIRDISERRRAEEELHRKTTFVKLLQVVAVAANEASTLQAALQFTLDQVCSYTGWPVGHAYILCAEPARTLMPTTIWHMDDHQQFETFRQVTERTLLAEGVGLPGRVLAERKPAWILDVTKDGNFPRAEAANDIGVRAGFAFPVMLGMEVVAVLEFFSAEAKAPDEALLDVLVHIGTQLGRVVERQRSDVALRSAHDELEVRVQKRTAELLRTNEILQAEVAERIRVEESLQLRDRAMAATTEGICITDPHQPDNPILYVNSGFERLTGYSRSDVLGQNCRFLQGPETDAAAAGQIRAALAEQREVNVELLNYRKDGTPFWNRLSITPVRDPYGVVSHFIGIQSDITERKAVERLKNELVSTVSHELRTPLTSLRGFVELLLSRSFAPEKQREFLTVVHRETLRLSNLINDFLDIQRIESGRHEYDFQSTDIALVLCESSAVFTQEDSKHHLSLQLPDDLPRVWADKDRIQQVITNLISNAVKFSPNGGQVTLRARRDAANVLISVQDQGLGIPPDAIPKLFSKFFRVDNRETRSIGGTGLGLALVKEIIEAHEGRVWVESELGRGSTFFFTLPPHVSRDAFEPERSVELVR